VDQRPDILDLDTEIGRDIGVPLLLGVAVTGLLTVIRRLTHTEASRGVELTLASRATLRAENLSKRRIM
jgi:hypothetical protein